MKERVFVILVILLLLSAGVVSAYPVGPNGEAYPPPITPTITAYPVTLPIMTAVPTETPQPTQKPPKKGNNEMESLIVPLVPLSTPLIK